MRLSISISAICCTPSEMRREGVRREIESVFDCNQVEALRRRGAALPYQQKGPDKVAHHVMQEAVAADDVDELLAPALEARLMNHANVRDVLRVGDRAGCRVNSPTQANRGLEWATRIFLSTLGTACAAVGVDCRKGGEVVLTKDQRSGLLHGGFIQRIRMVRDVARKEGRNDVAPPDAVLIALAARRVAGVEAGSDLLDRE